MKKTFAFIAFLLFATSGVFAQNIQPTTDFNKSETAVSATKNSRQTSGSSDYKPFEIFVGYSYSDSRFKEYNRDTRLQSTPRLDRIFSTRDKFKRGFAASGVYNFSRFAGVKADFSMNFNRRKATVNTRNVIVKERLTNYLVGVQIKDNSKSKNPFRPFAQALIGVSTSKSELKDCTAFGTVCPNSLNRSKTAFTYGIGGGLDLKVSDKVSIRAIQVDYLRGKVSDGLRFSSGIVF